jgi:hypothetical protein
LADQARRFAASSTVFAGHQVLLTKSNNHPVVRNLLPRLASMYRREELPGNRPECEGYYFSGPGKPGDFL